MCVCSCNCCLLLLNEAHSLHFSMYARVRQCKSVHSINHSIVHSSNSAVKSGSAGPSDTAHHTHVHRTLLDTSFELPRHTQAVVIGMKRQPQHYHLPRMQAGCVQRKATKCARHQMEEPTR